MYQFQLCTISKNFAEKHPSLLLSDFHEFVAFSYDYQNRYFFCVVFVEDFYTFDPNTAVRNQILSSLNVAPKLPRKIPSAALCV